VAGLLTCLSINEKLLKIFAYKRATENTIFATYGT
jgi:hypothetical protein